MRSNTLRTIAAIAGAALVLAACTSFKALRLEVHRRPGAETTTTTATLAVDEPSTAAEQIE